MSQPFSSEPYSGFFGQPFGKIHQVLSFNGSPYRSLISYFLKQRDITESANSSSESSTEDPSNRHSDSGQGSPNQGLYLTNNQSVPAEKETFFMSSIFNNVSSLDNHGAASTAANSAHAESFPTIAHIIQNACSPEARTGVNQEPGNANPEKKALNAPVDDPNESAQLQQQVAQLQQQMAQMNAKFEQVIQERAVQAVEINDLRATIEAQGKMIGEYKGALWALEASYKESVLRQTKRLDEFERGYQSDRIQASKLQKAKNDQLEANLKGMVDPMLNEAVEKAIRLVRRSGRPAPRPTRVSSTPDLSHLYTTRQHRPNQAK